MGGFGSGPAAKENIEADSEVDKSDQAEGLVDRTVGGFEYDLNVEAREGGGASRRAIEGAGDVIFCSAIAATAVDSADVVRKVCRGMFVDGLEKVSLADTGALAGGGNRGRVLRKAPVSLPSM